MLNLGWFSTGRGEGSRKLLSFIQGHIASGELPAQIEFVFCNREPSEAEGSDQFHALVHSYGIPLVILSSERFRREHGARRFDQVREQFDAEVIRRLQEFQPGIIVLAGYMLFTAAELCSRYNLLNLHPAPPGGPVGTWQQIVWDLIEHHKRESGIQLQLATMDWDHGPLISYCTFPIDGPEFAPLWQQVAGKGVEELKAAYWEDLPLFQAIRQEGQRREAPLLLETLRAITQGDVAIRNRHVVDRQGQPIAGHCLDRQVADWLRAHPEGGLSA